ncbi:hypothetical protein C1H46_001363 [Malus baccata]|uniref:Uncharacterized protein n=1 Tax=Malus baccata TaxID=106549 RepID=A0A540NPM3_MALBA|nr:hypothetical protein C1H46_001363 [Malus baccata]
MVPITFFSISTEGTTSFKSLSNCFPISSAITQMLKSDGVRKPKCINGQMTPKNPDAAQTIQVVFLSCHLHQSRTIKPTQPTQNQNHKKTPEKTCQGERRRRVRERVEDESGRGRVACSIRNSRRAGGAEGR